MTKGRAKKTILVPVMTAVALFVMVIPAPSQVRFRKSPPIPDPLRELRLPPIESAALSNGLRVVVAQRPESPMMSLQLVILSGESDSPRRVPGAAALTASMISRGTQRLSPGDIEEKIESIGGDFSTEVTLEQSIFTFNVLEENLDRALEIISALIIDPSFPEREMEAAKRNFYYELLEREKDPEYVAKRQLLRSLFQDHPYEGSTYADDAVRNIGLADIRAFHDAHYRPNNALLTIAGNMNLQTAARKVSHYFNTWIPREMGSRLVLPPRPNEEERIFFVDLPKATDATLYLGNMIFPASSPDYFPFVVLNQVLGGTTGSRLFMNLRESKGFAYYAFSGADFFDNCGVYWIRARVTPEVIYASVREILKEIGPSAVETITSMEIEQAKSFLIGNFPLKNETLSRFSSQVSRIKACNLSDDHWNKYYASIVQVNLERVIAAAQKSLQRRPVVVIVGDIQRIADYLLEFRRVDVYDTQGKIKWTITNAKGDET
ncbi:MAG: M16 family metallopeptidase [Candidatus Aminicenantales bacterium]